MDVHHGIIWSNNASFFGLEFGTGLCCFSGESGIRTASTFEYRIPAKKKLYPLHLFKYPKERFGPCDNPRDFP